MTKQLSAKFAYGVMAALTLSAVTVPNVSSADNQGISALFGQKQNQKFLPVHQAFSVNARTEGDVLVVDFRVTPEHYVYKDKINVKLPDGVSVGEWQFSIAPSTIDDPTFGNVAVFEKNFTAKATITSTKNLSESATVRWQGCAKAGLCYPPEMTAFTLTTKANHVGTQNPATKTDKSDQNPKATPKAVNVVQAVSDGAPTTHANTPKQNKSSADKPQSKSHDKSSDTSDDEVSDGNADKNASNKDATAVNTNPNHLNNTANADNPNDPNSINQDNQQASNTNQHEPSDSNADGVQAESGLTSGDQSQHDRQLLHALPKQADPFGLSTNPMLAIGLLFLAGLLLSLTPCVYPMIPIVANIVARQNNPSAVRGFVLSASYGVGVATAYGVLGALIAWFGQTINIIGHLQKPVVLLAFAVVFVLLALYMFDLLKISLPSGIRNRLHAKSQSADGKLGSVAGSFMVGALSALVVSPCVSAPMAGALAAVSVSGSVVLGFLALFALGFGLSVPLMVVGVAQGRFMPKAGAWMNHVKQFCGLLLLAVSVSLLERVMSSSWVLLVWAVWFALLAVWLYRLKALLAGALALISTAWVFCLMVGVATGAKDAWRPLSALSAKTDASHTHQDRHISTLDELDEILMTHDRVLVDLTAEWCVECRIMERELFTERPQVLHDYQVVKLDITETTEHSRAVLARYQLNGPPALLIYRDGKLVQMMLGQVGRADFESALTAHR